jgi:hypothetical protein
MSKSKREQGMRCPRMPGEVVDSEAAANEMRMTRQINVANGGMGQVNYVVKPCQCGRFHVLTDEHFTRWDSTRRAQQRERRRNA